MRPRFAFLVVTCASFGVAQACGGDSGVDLDGGMDVTVNDSTSPGDASNNDVAQPDDTGPGDDTGTGDATTDAPVDAGTDTGTKTITSWTCGNATVSDCALCIGHTQTCVYCGTMDASALAGSCVQEGTGCVGGGPMGYQTCTCTVDAGAASCPEPYQVCYAFNGHICLTCGEFNGTNGLTCENGGKCNDTDGGCN